MTDEEARTLKPGDVVYARVARRTVIASVQTVDQGSRGFPYPTIRVLFTDASGNRRCSTKKFSDQLELLSRRDPATANVFADWLDEQGEHRAAQLLRQAFPFCDGKIGDNRESK